MDEIKQELAKAAGRVAEDVAKDLVRPTSKSIGENVGLLVDGVMGWLGYWGQKQQIRREAYLEEYKKQIAKRLQKYRKKILLNRLYALLALQSKPVSFLLKKPLVAKCLLN